MRRGSIGGVLALLVALSTAGGWTRVLAEAPSCALGPDGTYSTPALNYPLPSRNYFVQYSLGGGPWLPAPVYLSLYGGTTSSPYFDFSGYTRLETSMSFVSIPARAGTSVQIRVQKVGSPFQRTDQVYVRPKAKMLYATVSDGTAQIVTWTPAKFTGDQFVLWWGTEPAGAATAGLAIFLDPPYPVPTGSNVKTVLKASDLDPAGLAGFDTLLFAPGQVAIGGDGAHAFVVPANIRTVYLAAGAWVQGKLHFAQSGGATRRITGPGVLDVSRFSYALRGCGAGSGLADQGYNAISWDPATGFPDTFVLDGPVITDPNRAPVDPLVNDTVNNVKMIGWNTANGGLRLGQGAMASNVFIRAGDDALAVWGSSVTVTNTTVWQNYNGGVVNLGWFEGSTGNQNVIDGLYVVKADWLLPTATQPSWTTTLLNNQNNAVFASLMVPGAEYGATQPSHYRNVFVDDPPQVLFSLKIVAPACAGLGLFSTCLHLVDLSRPSILNLAIENLMTPPSVAPNSIGFQNLGDYPYEFPAGTFNVLPAGYTLTGSMILGLTNVIFELPDGTLRPLTNANAGTLGQINTNGSVIANYGLWLGGPH
jgi:hypothetical protein